MKDSSRLIFGITVVFAFFLFFIIVLADEDALPGFLASYAEMPYFDKVGHFFLMGTLAFLVNLALRCSNFRIGPLHVLKGSLIVMILVTLEECSQIYFPSRTFSFGDLLADYVGIFLFGQAALFLVHRRIKAG